MERRTFFVDAMPVDLDYNIKRKHRYKKISRKTKSKNVVTHPPMDFT